MNLLNEIMLKRVNKYVESYKTDVEYDFKLIQDRNNYHLDVKKFENKDFKVEEKYYWILRKCGTQLLNQKEVFFLGSNDRVTFNYYKNQNDIAAIYEIVVNDVVGEKIYGTIKKLKLDKVEEEIKSKSKVITSITIKVLVKDVKEPIIFTTDSIDNKKRDLYKILEQKKLEFENVVKTYCYYN